MSKHLPINEITRVELVQDLLDEYDDNSKFYESFTTLIASYFKVRIIITIFFYLQCLFSFC